MGPPSPFNHTSEGTRQVTVYEGEAATHKQSPDVAWTDRRRLDWYQLAGEACAHAYCVNAS